MHWNVSYFRPAFAPGVVLAMLLAPVGAWSAQQEQASLQQRIDRLIRELGDESYVAREEAQNELAKLGFAAYEALQAATEHPDLEVATRARYLLRLIRVQWTQEGDPPEVEELLSDYEFQPAEERLERIRRLGSLKGGQGTSALCRLVRFEGSELLSKYAAIEILDRRPPDPQRRKRWTETLRRGLPRAGRPAADWLLSYLQLEDDAAAALAAWAKLVDAEQALLGRRPMKTNSNIVVSLLYHLAEAQAEHGQRPLSEETAARARALNPGESPAALIAHWQIALSLQRRGLFRWAEAEYRHVIDSNLPELQVRGRILLSEMKHDQQDHLGAAETLEALFDIDSRQLQLILTQIERTVNEVRARMNYFYARHWREKDDRDKEREYLDKAIASDPGEIDALIGRYRLPDRSEEYHQQTLDLIARAVDIMRREIEMSPDSPTHYNQLAWLVGNTEGDLDEALELSRRAIELSPNSGAYHDTLAHVYFARGEYKKAVDAQTRAAELEPHSGLINKQLEVFRAKLKEAEREAGAAETPTEKPPGSKPPGSKPPAAEPSEVSPPDEP